MRVIRKKFASVIAFFAVAFQICAPLLYMSHIEEHRQQDHIPSPVFFNLSRLSSAIRYSWLCSMQASKSCSCQNKHKSNSVPTPEQIPPNCPVCQKFETIMYHGMPAIVPESFHAFDIIEFILPINKEIIAQFYVISHYPRDPPDAAA